MSTYKMAARLNTPADFLPTVPPVSGGLKHHDLLPPSIFRVPQHKVPDDLEELVKATSEILDLKAQNQKLRTERHLTITPTEEIKARINVHHQQPPLVAGQQTSHSLSHVDEIIQRQAADISSLREKLTVTQVEYQKQEARWEGRQTLLEAKHHQQVTALQAELDITRGRYQDEVRHLQEESSRESANHRDTIQALEAQLHTSQSEHSKRVGKLENMLADLKSQLEHTQKQNEESQREKAAEIAEAKRQVTQLKTYIAETDSTSKASETWKRQLDNINSKLKWKEEDNLQLQNQVALLSMRLQSQDKIVQLQEQGLSQVKGESEEKKKVTLLTQWREKVYALMMQSKSADVCHKQEEHKWRLKVADLEEQLAVAQHQSDLQRAALEDKDAELRMSQNQVMVLQAEVTRTQDVALSLDDRLANQTDLLCQLVQFTQKIWQQFKNTLQALAQLQGTLTAYDQRISFAAGRVHLLQSQFSRKEAVLRLKFEEALHDRPTRDQVKEINPKEECGDVETLAEELQRVTAERDQMALHLEEDARLLQSQVGATRRHCEEQVTSLEHRLEELHQQLEDKTQTLVTLQHRLEESQSKTTEAEEELQKVKTDLARIQLHANTEAEAQLNTERAQFTEQLAEMEHRTNEARREHTKAVVSLRQQERAMNREQERAARQLSEMEIRRKDQLSRLEHKLHSIDKDRNMLMITLRQEGLVGKYRNQRLVPVQLEETSDDDVDRTDQNPDASEEKSDSEPLHAVIDDLKSLTADVMDESPDITEVP